MTGPDELRPLDRLNAGLLVEAILRRWYIVLICAVVTPSVTYLVVDAKPDVYETTAQLLFRERVNDADPSVPTSPDPDRQAATNRDLVALPALAQRTSAALGGTVTPADVAARIDATESPESDVSGIQATGENPQETARLANTYAAQFVVYKREERRKQFAAARKVLAQRLARLRGLVSPAARNEARQLRERIGALDLASSLEDGGVEVIQQAAAPKVPVSPRPKVDAAIGFGLGLALGLVLALALEALDRRLRSLQSVHSAFTRPVIGAIPRSRALGKRAHRKQYGLPPGEIEAFRMLRASMLYNNDDLRLNAVLVTSAGLAEGKTTVAWNLAAAAADAGSRVLLIEADLRRPVLARRFHADPSQGLSEILTSEADPESVLQHVRLNRFAVNGTTAMMDVIFAGAPLSNPIDPLESERMADLVARMRGEYDLLVLDSPPVSVVSDAIPLIRYVDGVLVVSRVGTTTREAAAHVQSQLDNLGAPVLGVVVNGIDPDEGHYGYAYQTAERRLRPWRGRVASHNGTGPDEAEH